MEIWRGPHATSKEINVHTLYRHKVCEPKTARRLAQLGFGAAVGVGVGVGVGG